MQTKVSSPSDDAMRTAARFLRAGKVVVFPTETVYGLGADATNVDAVAKIFIVKNRPQDNPLIVHVAHTKDIEKYAYIDNDIQQTIINKLMPGPLTLLLRKKENIPDTVVAGQSHVGIRIPDHIVARHMIHTAGCPIAAPSANISGKPSPTSAEMALVDLEGKVPLIIDGGPCVIGIESTVVKVVDNTIIIHRPGFITQEDIEQVFVGQNIQVRYLTGVSQEAPGNKHKHYAPKAKIHSIQSLNQHTKKLCTEKTALIATKEFLEKYADFLESCDQKGVVLYRGTHTNLLSCAQSLFHLYHTCDKLGITTILIEQLPEVGVGYAIMNRVKKSIET